MGADESRPHLQLLKPLRKKLNYPAVRSHTRDRIIAHRFLTDGKPTPLSIMVENARFWDGEAQQLLNRLIAISTSDGDVTRETIALIRELTRCRDRAEACARDAAPYIHARLAAISVSNRREVDDGLPYTLVLEAGEENL